MSMAKLDLVGLRKTQKAMALKRQHESSSWWMELHWAALLARLSKAPLENAAKCGPDRDCIY